MPTSATIFERIKQKIETASERSDSSPLNGFEALGRRDDRLVRMMLTNFADRRHAAQWMTQCHCAERPGHMAGIDSRGRRCVVEGARSARRSDQILARGEIGGSDYVVVFAKRDRAMGHGAAAVIQAKGPYEAGSAGITDVVSDLLHRQRANGE